MTNQLTEIESQLESFLQTNPESEIVNSLIDRLKEYQSECQRQAVKADLAWKEQLPETFPKYPKDKGLREKFRRMFNQLNKQGISVEYARPFFGEHFEQWLLTAGDYKTEGQTLGRLTWHKTENKWEIDGFYFQDEEGNPIDEFNDVISL
jgi:hypothetical protein